MSVDLELSLDERHEDMSAEEFTEMVQQIGLTEDKIRFVLDRDDSE